VKATWWLGQRRTIVYMVRELTSFFIAVYCALIVIGLFRLASGAAAWEGFVAALTSPGMVLLQLICLAFAVFHSVTWFAVTPKAMPIMVKGEPVAPRTIVGAHYAVWLVVSLVILAAAGM
jgi:fumarate reductase subunit C